MTVALWGGGTTDDLAERIRTGDVAVDLYRPVGLFGWYLAGDLGRATYHCVTRGVGPDAARAAALPHRAAADAGRRGRLPGQPGAGRGHQLRDPVPGRLQRRSGCSTRPGCRCSPGRSRSSSAGWRCRWCSSPGWRGIALGAAVGGVPPGRRPTSGSASTRAVAWSARSASRRLGRRAARAVRRRAARSATRKVVVQGG